MGKQINQLVLHWIHRIIYSIWIKPLESHLIPAIVSKKPGKIRNQGLILAEWLANLGRVAVLDLRVAVKCLRGPDWAVIYMGEGIMEETLSAVLFSQPPQAVELKHISLWQLAEEAARYARQGDLVICELNEIIPWKPTSEFLSFTMPIWVTQELVAIDRPIDDLLAGMNQTMRRSIRRLEGKGYNYVYTRAQEDFDLFYHRMHRPYIQTRFQGRGAVLHDYTSVRDIFQKGGLILVRQGQEPVCGMICEISGDTCIAKQMGVMDGRFDLVKAGAEVALWWFMLDWAREQGAKNFNFGASWALTTNGTFNFKRQWGTRVRKFEAMHARWNFLAQSLPARLVDHLNTQGLITEYQNGFFSTVFLNPGESITGDKLADQRKRAAVFGLDNILAIAPDGNRYFLQDSVDELH